MTQPTAKYFLDALYEYAAEAIAEEVVTSSLRAYWRMPSAARYLTSRSS